MTTKTAESYIEFTDGASERVRSFIEEEGELDLSVRISVVSPSPLDPRYDMALITPEERDPEDEVVEIDGFEVVMEPESAELLEGARVDWVESLDGSGFKVENPNLRPIGSEPLEGPVAERVEQVIDEQVNPAVAQHGGQVSLVDVRDDTVYVRMGGGCQGCGMANVTLTQGIERMITDAVPEIENIEDVTDHAAGSNPYY